MPLVFYWLCLNGSFPLFYFAETNQLFGLVVNDRLLSVESAPNSYLKVLSAFKQSFYVKERLSFNLEYKALVFSAFKDFDNFTVADYKKLCISRSQL